MNKQEKISAHHDTKSDKAEKGSAFCGVVRILTFVKVGEKLLPTSILEHTEASLEPRM